MLQACSSTLLARRLAAAACACSSHSPSTCSRGRFRPPAPLLAAPAAAGGRALRLRRPPCLLAAPAALPSKGRPVRSARCWRPGAAPAGAPAGQRAPVGLLGGWWAHRRTGGHHPVDTPSASGALPELSFSTFSNALWSGRCNAAPGLHPLTFIVCTSSQAARRSSVVAGSSSGRRSSARAFCHHPGPSASSGAAGRAGRFFSQSQLSIYVQLLWKSSREGGCWFRLFVRW